MRTKLQYADTLFKNPQWMSGDVLGGFNVRVMGGTWDEACGYPTAQYAYAARNQGYNKACEMIETGEIYYRHIFPHEGCNGNSFNYGGTHVCNKCGRRDLAQPWWNIRVFKDGNAYCVVGEDFQNLQGSDNYAFGDTKDEALKNYQELMETKT